MATPENTFIRSVNKHLPADVYYMKNHNQYTGGIPDVWYSGLAGDLWIEYKFVVLPKRGETMITPDLSALQVDWLRCRNAEGRSVGVIVGTKDGGIWLPGISGLGKSGPGGVSAASITKAEFDRKIVSRSSLAETIAKLVL